MKDAGIIGSAILYAHFIIAPILLILGLRKKSSQEKKKSFLDDPEMKGKFIVIALLMLAYATVRILQQ